MCYTLYNAVSMPTLKTVMKTQTYRTNRNDYHYRIRNNVKKTDSMLVLTITGDRISTGI